jgi:hypothetical protein
MNGPSRWSIFSRRAKHDPFEYQVDWPSCVQIHGGFVRAGGLDYAETGLSQFIRNDRAG